MILTVLSVYGVNGEMPFRTLVIHMLILTHEVMVKYCSWIKADFMKLKGITFKLNQTKP